MIDESKIVQIVRQILFMFVVIIPASLAGWWVFVYLFANLAPGETEEERLAKIFTICILSSLSIGIIFYRYWYLSIVVSWGSILLLFLVVTRDGRFIGNGLLLNIAIIGSTVMFGYFGLLIRNFYERKMRKH